MGEPQMEGCMNPTACNYDENATINNNECHENDECGLCNGDGSTCNISYSGYVQNIFNDNCINCHGISGGLNLTSHENLMLGGISGATIIPNDGSNSLLIKKLRGTATGGQMPPQCCLDESTIITLIETWINEGAENN